MEKEVNLRINAEFNFLLEKVISFIHLLRFQYIFSLIKLFYKLVANIKIPHHKEAKN